MDTHEVTPKLILSLVVFASTIGSTVSAEVPENESGVEHTPEKGAIAAVIICVGLVVMIVVLSLCGGCTPMEVGSDAHAGSGGRKTDYTQYSGVVTDVNTSVMTSGTTFADDPYQPQDVALPYNPHPQTAHHTFSGYNSQVSAPPQQATQASYQQPGQGAHRHFSEAEPPPPAYTEAVCGPGHSQVPGIRPNAPAQPYGW